MLIDLCSLSRPPLCSTITTFFRSFQFPLSFASSIPRSQSPATALIRSLNQSELIGKWTTSMGWSKPKNIQTHMRANSSNTTGSSALHQRTMNPFQRVRGYTHSFCTVSGGGLGTATISKSFDALTKLRLEKSFHADDGGVDPPTKSSSVLGGPVEKWVS